LPGKSTDYIIQNTIFKILNQGLRGAKPWRIAKTARPETSPHYLWPLPGPGIPARPVVGAYAQSGLNSQTIWAEFYLEQVGWIPVDAEAGLNNLEKRNYYFGTWTTGASS